MYEDAKAGKLLATENEEESSEAAETSKPDSDEKTTKEEEKKGEDKTATTGTVTHSCTYVNIELKLNRQASTIRTLHILYCRILSYDVMIVAFCVKVYS